MGNVWCLSIFLTDTPREGSTSTMISREGELIKISACDHQCCYLHFSFLKKQQVDVRNGISLKYFSCLEDIKSKCRKNVLFFFFFYMIASESSKELWFVVVSFWRDEISEIHKSRWGKTFFQEPVLGWTLASNDNNHEAVATWILFTRVVLNSCQKSLYMPLSASRQEE